MDCSRAELGEEFVKEVNLDENFLYRRLHDELYRLNGEPFGCLIVDYEFDTSVAEDISLLERLGRIGAANVCPILSVAPLPSFSGTSFVPSQGDQKER